MKVDTYKNKCSCGKYETSFDMVHGTAMSAATLHIMLDGKHRVEVMHWVNGMPTVTNIVESK